MFIGKSSDTNDSTNDSNKNKNEEIEKDVAVVEDRCVLCVYVSVYVFVCGCVYVWVFICMWQK